jgi:ribonucleoside-diphosphate reductase alpha chain
VYNDKMQVVEKRTNELEIADKIERFIDPVTGRDILDVVLSIEDNNRYDKTYCVREPLTGKAVFNNILTGNCIEITQPTAPYLDMKDLYSSEDHGRGEVSTCSLGAIAVCNITSDEEYEKTAYYTLKMIDECIHLSDYPLPHMEVTVKKRLNAGVGIIGLATSLARAGLSYSSKEGKRLIHEIAERHAYFVIKASLKRGKELGNAPWMHKTKWPLGWLPIDTYKKTVDQIVEPTYKYDWETLRQEIITNGGIRNSSLIAHMPTESSSKASGVPNGVYPIRGNSLKKKDGSNIIDWCATDSDLLEGKYDIAWNIPTKDMIECYAIIQKFTDQAISADFYKDRSIDLTITDEEMISDYLHFVKFGQKTRYYQNSLTSNQAGEKVESESLAGCASGVCTL